MKKILYTFILFFVFTMVQAQTVDDKAKAYYQEAQKAFESRNYKQVIDYCKQVTDVLKTTNARIELLRIKSYFELGEYDKVKATIKTFTNLQASADLKNEALEYLVKLEKAEKEAEEKRLAEQRRLEQDRVAKEQKLAEEKRLKEEAERVRIDDERRRKAEEQRREDSGLLLQGKWKGVQYGYYSNSPNRPEYKSKEEYELIIEEKGDIIIITRPMVSSDLKIFEARLVSDQGGIKKYKGTKRVKWASGTKGDIEYTYNDSDKTFSFYLNNPLGGYSRIFKGTFRISY